MQDNSAAKIRSVIARPGMFIREGNLTYAIAFLSGLNYSSTTKPLDGFHDWLVDNYFDEPKAQAWEALIEEIPNCSTGEHKNDVDAFLGIVRKFLDFAEGV